MRNTQCITKCYLGYLCYSHEVEKTERLRYSKVKKVKRKWPHVTRICVLHKVVWFLFFLGFSQDINFYPFGRNWEWEGLPWNNWYSEVKPNILKRAIPRILLFSQCTSFFFILCPYLFLSRSFLFSLIFSEFGQSALTVWEHNLRMRGFSFSPSFSSFTVANALAILNALTHWKTLK